MIHTVFSGEEITKEIYIYIKGENSLFLGQYCTPVRVWVDFRDHPVGVRT
jgi:hypothetical protein